MHGLTTVTHGRADLSGSYSECLDDAMVNAEQYLDGSVFGLKRQFPRKMYEPIPPASSPGQVVSRTPENQFPGLPMQQMHVPSRALLDIASLRANKLEVFFLALNIPQYLGGPSVEVVQNVYHTVTGCADGVVVSNRNETTENFFILSVQINTLCRALEYISVPDLPGDFPMSAAFLNTLIQRLPQPKRRVGRPRKHDRPPSHGFDTPRRLSKMATLEDAIYILGNEASFLPSKDYSVPAIQFPNTRNDSSVPRHPEMSQVLSLLQDGPEDDTRDADDLVRLMVLEQQEIQRVSITWETQYQAELDDISQTTTYPDHLSAALASSTRARMCILSCLYAKELASLESTSTSLFVLLRSPEAVVCWKLLVAARAPEYINGALGVSAVSTVKLLYLMKDLGDWYYSRLYWSTERKNLRSKNGRPKAEEENDIAAALDLQNVTHRMIISEGKLLLFKNAFDKIVADYLASGTSSEWDTIITSQIASSEIVNGATNVQMTADGKRKRADEALEQDLNELAKITGRHDLSASIPVKLDASNLEGSKRAIERMRSFETKH